MLRLLKFSPNLIWLSLLAKWEGMEVISGGMAGNWVILTECGGKLLAVVVSFCWASVCLEVASLGRETGEHYIISCVLFSSEL